MVQDVFFSWVFKFFSGWLHFFKDSSLQALSFTNFEAEDLGAKLLTWGKAEWNHGHVTVQKVKNSKKKNKGKKRVLWQDQVKAFHRGEGKGKGKSLEVKKDVQFPDAPWWKMPITTEVTEQNVEEIPDDEEEKSAFRAFGP